MSAWNRTSAVSGSTLNQSFSWNGFGQLASVNTTVASGGSTGLVAYGYDGWGRRVRRSLTRGGVTTTTGYLHAGDHVVAELSATGAVVADYAWHPGVDAPHSLRRGSQIYYYTQEPEGNVTALLGASGTVANRYAYTAFGELQTEQETVPNPFRFKGTAYDSTARLYHMRARDYDPGLGRFVSEDPIGLEGGINTYAFAGNDPVNNRDPSGLDFLVECTPIYGWSRAGTPLYPGSWTPYVKGFNCSSHESGGPGIGADNSALGGGGGRRPGQLSQATPASETTSCTGAQLNFAVTAAGDIAFFAGGLGIAVRGAQLAIRAGRVAKMAQTARYARTNRYAVAIGQRNAAGSVTGLLMGAHSSTYLNAHGAFAIAVQSPNVSWQDFVPLLAMKRAGEQMTSACGY